MHSHSLLSPVWPKVYRRPSSFQAHVYFLQWKLRYAHINASVLNAGWLRVNLMLRSMLCVYRFTSETKARWTSSSADKMLMNSLSASMACDSSDKIWKKSALTSAGVRARRYPENENMNAHCPPKLVLFSCHTFFDFILILTKLSFRSNPNILLTSLSVRYPNIWLARELRVCGWCMRSVSMQQVFLYYLYHDQWARSNA